MGTDKDSEDTHLAANVGGTKSCASETLIEVAAGGSGGDSLGSGIADLAGEADPGPGSSAFTPRKSILSRPIIMVALSYRFVSGYYWQFLKNCAPKDITLHELVAGTNALTLHRRLNSWGDAAGKLGLCLDRGPRNEILLTKANFVRCARLLSANRIAGAQVASLLPGVVAGDDLLAKANEAPAAK